MDNECILLSSDDEVTNLPTIDGQGDVFNVKREKDDAGEGTSKQQQGDTTQAETSNEVTASASAADPTEPTDDELDEDLIKLMDSEDPEDKALLEAWIHEMWINTAEYKKKRKILDMAQHDLKLSRDNLEEITKFHKSVNDKIKLYGKPQEK